MDVDVARTSRLSDKERKALVAEGKCFHCKQKGHLFRECPTCPKDKGKGKTTQRKNRKARAVELNDDGEEPQSEKEPKNEGKPPAYSMEDLKIALAQLSKEDRDEVIEGTELGEEDF